MQSMHWRTHTVEVTRPSIDGVEAFEIADCALSGTVAALENNSPLLDWDEYNNL